MCTCMYLIYHIEPHDRVAFAANCVSSLTHWRLNELQYTMYWKILISILGMSGYVI